jgi:hypothetical protein
MNDALKQSIKTSLDNIMKSIQTINLHPHRDMAPVVSINIIRIHKGAEASVEFQYEGKDTEIISSGEFKNFLFEMMKLYSITYVAFHTTIAKVDVSIKWRMKETLIALRKIQKIIDSIDGTGNEYVDEDAEDEEDELDESPWAPPTSGWKPADEDDFYRHISNKIVEKTFH